MNPCNLGYQESEAEGSCQDYSCEVWLYAKTLRVCSEFGVVDATCDFISIHQLPLS